MIKFTGSTFALRCVIAAAMALTLSLPSLASGRDKLQRDTVLLHSGEILIGEIKELRLGMLTIDSKDVGLTTLKISKISTINSASDTLRIETSDKSIRFGALRPSSKPGWVYIVADGHRREVEIGSLNSLVIYQRKFLQNLTGNVSAGFSYSRSSGIGQLNFSFKVGYASRRFDIGFSGSGMSSIDTTTFSHDRAQVDVMGLYNIRGMWYGVASLDYQRNLELSILRRYQELLGGAYKVVISRNFQIMGLGGLSLSQERSTSGVDQNSLCELPVGLWIDYYKFSHPNIQVSSQHIFYTGLTQWGRVRYDASTTFNWELIKNFSFSVNLYMNFDSRPPDPTSGKMDYGTVVGLTFRY